MTREAVIVAGTRTAVGKAVRGSTKTARSDEMMATVIQELMRQTNGRLDPLEIDDVIVGCAMPEGAQGLNFARVIALRAGLPVETAAQTVNRFCSSGLQTIAMAAERIIAGGADIIIAGGAESMSLVPMSGHHISPNPYMAEHDPNVYMSMGHTAERVASEHNVSREDMDAFALQSHQKAAAAYDSGKFADEIVPFSWEETVIGENGLPTTFTQTITVDEHLRRETTLEALAKLKPVFKPTGSVTAGNSSPLSDGAAGVIVMEAETAARLGFTPIARFVGFNVMGVRPEVMGIGPVAAVPKLLKRAGMSLDQIDLIELNEAFASQALAVIRALDMNPDIVNVNGGAIALGHPLGCTGAKLTVTLMNEMKRRNSKYGMVTMCIGGGMGAAGIFENLN
ncbi:MAG: acetyl-CoA C-acyltransferase [Chloroflexi bacterium]|jgi:acetyl-CoA acyltransferase|nr:acetyl-CoA C-acyltransferase [Chloroflexota bacterium]MDL1916067.1 acetyl-CoA C-acyltransferase [Anaerolineae bacterium CFX4]MEB2366928.1 acetyl-CoA C-acyltransferase [Chloroflexota bacterium]OQY82987.1 MAG: acetyl-CoA acetyltransferase [Anaerolineae bacterium UTCFX5]GIK30068.1 MAG: acetyl-CoA acetyltransferase [Chloroflexota bacterium]